MGNKKLALYLHLVWATWDRTPWIIPQIERQIYRSIIRQVYGLGCKALAINGMPDHVHLAVKFHSTICVAELVKKSKGVSSRFINQSLNLNDQFKWQIGYGAFSISRWDLHKVINYVKSQKEHHSDNDLDLDLEAIYEN
ncbi:MAG: IS200/IS605 family transposase [Anaerolineales bacterium]|nr:IS200/IS605 family transposase [Anaerolineales bacterium]